MSNYNDLGGTNGHNKQQPNDPLQHASRAVAEAQAFGRSISAATGRLQSSLDLNNRVHRSPIASLLVAAGIGYVLGGGLFSPVTKKALKLGLRLAIIPFVKGQISGLVGGAAGQMGEPL